MQDCWMGLRSIASLAPSWNSIHFGCFSGVPGAHTLWKCSNWFSLISALWAPHHPTPLSPSLQVSCAASQPLPSSYWQKLSESFKAAMPLSHWVFTSDSLLPTPLATYIIIPFLLLSSVHTRYPEKYPVTAGISYSEWTLPNRSGLKPLIPL